MYASRNFFPTLAVLGLLFSAACADADLTTGPVAGDLDDDAITAVAAPAPAASAAPDLLPCPTPARGSATGLLRVLGGVLRLDGHHMRIPFLAILRPTRFEMEVPASRHLEVTIHAVGHASFEFRRPVRVTVDYSHCPAAEIPDAPLHVWHVDPVTGAALEHMGGIDDRAARTITFETDHLSTFSLAR